MMHTLNTEVNKIKWDPVLFERETESEAERQTEIEQRYRKEKYKETHKRKKGISDREQHYKVTDM